MPRSALVHMIVQMANHRKLSFMGDFKKQTDQGLFGQKLVGAKIENSQSVFELIDTRFYQEDQSQGFRKIDLSQVFGKDFKN